MSNLSNRDLGRMMDGNKVHYYYFDLFGENFKVKDTIKNKYLLKNYEKKALEYADKLKEIKEFSENIDEEKINELLLKQQELVKINEDLEDELVYTINQILGEKQTEILMNDDISFSVYTMLYYVINNIFKGISPETSIEAYEKNKNNMEENSEDMGE